MRTFLSILVILIWVLLGWCYMQDYNGCCSKTSLDGQEVGVLDDGKSADVRGEDNVNSDVISSKGNTDANIAINPSRWKGPLTFKWDSDKPILGNTWNSYRDSMIAALPKDQLLQITGFYRDGEADVEGFDNLGLARANTIRDLFSSIPDDRIRFFSKEVAAVDGDKTKPYNGVSYRFLINTEKIKEIEDKTVIYFPYNSTNKLNDMEVEAYLDDVADRIKKSNEQVRLTGHTDSVGDPQSNLRMGQWRADVISNYLISKGVSQSQIITISRGESDPAATNATSEGRAQNRRTELQIIK